jgi:hypothetical protein
LEEGNQEFATLESSSFYYDISNSQVVKKSLLAKNGEDPPAHTFIVQSSTPF